MRKIIIASLLMTSAVAFAKTEEPKVKTDQSKNEEKILVAKKNFKEEKVKNKIIVNKNKALILISPSTMCFIYESVLSQILIPYIPDYGKCMNLAEAGF